MNGELVFIEENPATIWRNIAVSKDGSRIALTTTDQDNQIFIGELSTGSVQGFTLTSPTFGEGIDTDNVRFADAMEWEPGGEFLMYDALSELDDGITFWDINFLRAYDASTNNLSDGAIFKLYQQLEAGTSIGNPTFSKNSPFIITFDRQNAVGSDAPFSVLAANIETGETSVVWNNEVIGFPNYGVGDDRIVFDVAGRLVLTSSVAGDRASLDLSALAAGQYFVAVPTVAGVVIRRVLRR